jgi:predicted amidohydrolase YtcJ
MPRAEGFAVKDGRFLAIGSAADIRNITSSRTRVVDGAGMCVLPGFTDAHCHPSGVNELFGVVVTQFKTKAELIEALRKKAAATPPGFWVEGELFDDTKLTDPTPLDRHDLDKVSTEHPVEVNHRGGHTSGTTARCSSWRESPRRRRTRNMDVSSGTRQAN